MDPLPFFDMNDKLDLFSSLARKEVMKLGLAMYSKDDYVFFPIKDTGKYIGYLMNPKEVEEYLPNFKHGIFTDVYTKFGFEISLDMTIPQLLNTLSKAVTEYRMFLNA